MSSSSSLQKAPRKRDALTIVACNRCRTRKSKCDGVRPACSSCVQRGDDCEYTAEPDAFPSVAMKRRYEMLQQQNDEREQLLHHLRTATESDAQEMLQKLRLGEDISSLNLYAQELQSVDGTEDNLEPMHQRTEVKSTAEMDGVESSASVTIEQTSGEGASRSFMTLEPRVEVTPMVPSLRSLRHQTRNLSRSSPEAVSSPDNKSHGKD
ncbi:hypothetical protein Q7P37_010425 [Cladosporium fusiforme]